MRGSNVETSPAYILTPLVSSKNLDDPMLKKGHMHVHWDNLHHLRCTTWD